MMFSNDRDSLRDIYLTVFRKLKSQSPLTPLEQQIGQVILEHPEYHAQLTPETQHAAYYPELGQSNPFLHMGLHLALREQYQTNRPAGFRNVYDQLIQKFIQQGKNQLDAEHLMMEALTETLWTAQRTGTAPDEQFYLEQLQKLLNGFF